MILFSRAVAIAVLSLPLLSCGKKERSAGETPVTVLKGVAVEVVKPEALPEVLDVVGTVRSRTAAMVSPRIAGVIAVMRVKEGDRVKKGDSDRPSRCSGEPGNALAAVNAVEDARRALDESIARKELAVTQFERYRNLLKGDVVSRQEFELKETEKELALQGVARAEARLKQAQEQARGGHSGRLHQDHCADLRNNHLAAGRSGRDGLPGAAADDDRG